MHSGLAQAMALSVSTSPVHRAPLVTPQPVPGGLRVIPFGVLAPRTEEVHYPLNTIITSKYTPFNFVPLNLWEQFHKAANTYFLVISIIMALGQYTTLFKGFIKFWSTAAALLVMMSASAVMAALDDKRRHQADARTNSQRAVIVAETRRGRVSVDKLEWACIKVGDILLVQSEEEFPADMVLLASSSEGGLCYVSTANLDGETNLKIKTAAASTQKELLSNWRTVAGTDGRPPSMSEIPPLDQAVENISKIGGHVQAEAPQMSIHNFTGSLRMGHSPEEALGPKQLLLRGTLLRNTKWCIGLVVYTGPETRMVMNSQKAKPKYANIESVVNRSLVVVIGALCLLALTSDVFYLMTKNNFQNLWYLFPEGTMSAITLPEPIGYWFTFFILYSNLMPISLYFTMEVCNAMQSYFIKSDLKMYDEEQDCPANARTTNLSHELGQVGYIFSDKTGTLTQNVMELKRIAVGNDIYGTTSEARGFQGGAALATARQQPKKADAIDAFLEILAVSHTVVSTRDQNGQMRYEAESPDEGALVDAAAALGWVFHARTSQTLSVEIASMGNRTYTVLALNAFTSSRKRQSMVVRKPSGEVVLLVKGADDIMQLRAANPASFPMGHLTTFAKEGLRTLVLGRRVLSEAEFNAWHLEYSSAQAAMQDREGALAAVADKIEQRLEIVGVTAIEDKLQVGVPSTIVKIREAGIKLWVLTGDKLETARNIGFSTRVLSSEMEIFIMDQPSLCKEQLDTFDTLSREIEASKCGRVMAILVTGQFLEVALHQDSEENDLSSSDSTSRRTPALPKLATSESCEGRHEKQFLEVAKRCSVVIACRVSPLQKAEMVRIVRRGIKPTPVTLAIGDGANDVPMIQEAQVGVGISGREGRQAVNSADFAIAQFRYLERLLLVHGRWNYRRACKFVLYSFWKNSVLVLLMFYYTFISGYAGTSLFEDMVRASYNFVLGTPIIATGVFDRDLSEAEVLDNPGLYASGRLGLDLNPIKLLEMLLSALVHSLVILLVMSFASESFSLVGAGDFYTFGTTVFSVLIIAMNYRVIFITRTWNWISVVSWLFSFVFYGFFLVMYCMVRPLSDVLSPWMYMVPQYMFGNALFWVCATTVPALAIVIDVFKYFLVYEFFPDESELLIERYRLHKAERRHEAMQGTALQPSCSFQAAHSQPSMLSRHSTYSLSSFDFAHPGGEPRHHAAIRNSHPMQGDTSLLDTLELAPPTFSRAGTTSFQATAPLSHAAGVAEEVSEGSSTSDSAVLPREGPLVNRPDDSAFSQQTMRSVQLEITWRAVLTSSICVGALLMLLGIIVLAVSAHVVQIRILYSGKARGSIWSVFDDASDTLLQGGQWNCTEPSTCANVATVARTMEPPIYLYYLLDPFYQNYPDYWESADKGVAGAWEELTGNIQSLGVERQLCQRFPTWENQNQTVYPFPCGLAATSFFNDTFEVRDSTGKVLEIDHSNVAWPTDVQRFQNPSASEGYPQSPMHRWLFDRYPAIVNASEGVRNQRFVAWMRAQAWPNMLKPYGRILTRLEQNTRLNITISSQFPVSHLGVRKQLLLTTTTPLGGRSGALGYFMVFTGSVCWMISLIVLAIQVCCKREQGTQRCRGDTHAEGRHQSDTEDSEESTDGGAV